jgi:uncharacterized protein YndB with AHSA1/START domain
METTSSGKATVTFPTDEQLLITREFDAPKHLVYRAWTTPELVRRWWAGLRGTMDVVEIDLRVGGSWRYVMAATGGHEVAFHGEFRELVPEERIVHTEVYEAMPDAEALDTVTFTTLEGDRTVVHLLMEVATKEQRDGVVASGMEGGMQEQMDVLEELVRGLG